MFKIFKKNTNNNIIIEEIHTTFYSEADKLLVLAKNSNSLETNKQELIEKSKKIKKTWI